MAIYRYELGKCETISVATAMAGRQSNAEFQSPQLFGNQIEIFQGKLKEITGTDDNRMLLTGVVTCKGENEEFFFLGLIGIDQNGNEITDNGKTGAENIKGPILAMCPPGDRITNGEVVVICSK